MTGSVPGAQDTGKSLTLSYAVGNAAGRSSPPSLTTALTPIRKGDIYTAPFQFDGYTVQDQAFRQSTLLPSFYPGLFRQYSPRREYILFLY